MEHDSGVGVLDKAVRVLDALESGPAALAELVDRTGLPRATAHRLAVALEVHRLVARDAAGRFALGPRLAVSNPLVAAISVSGPMERLTRTPGKRFGAAVTAAAHRLEEALAAGAA